MSLTSSLFVSLTILETKKPLRIEGILLLLLFFLIPKICALQLGSSPELMMVLT